MGGLFFCPLPTTTPDALRILGVRANLKAHMSSCVESRIDLLLIAGNGNSPIRIWAGSLVASRWLLSLQRIRAFSFRRTSAGGTLEAALCSGQFLSGMSRTFMFLTSNCAWPAPTRWSEFQKRRCGAKSPVVWGRIHRLAHRNVSADSPLPRRFFELRGADRLGPGIFEKHDFAGQAVQ